MSLMSVMLGSSTQPVDSSGGSAVIPTIADELWNSEDYGPVYSGVRFSSDGKLYRRQSGGTYSAIATWLFKGTASTYYLKRTTNDTLTTDSGSSWLQLNADLDFDVQYSLPKADGSATADVTFELSDDVSGSPVISGPKVYTFVATVGVGL